MWSEAIVGEDGFGVFLYKIIAARIRDAIADNIGRGILRIEIIGIIEV